MNSLFGSLLGKKPADGIVGVEFANDGIALVHLVNHLSAQPTLQHCEFISCDSSADRQALLASRVKDLGLQGCPCRFVLSRGQYQFLLVDAPKVPAEELNEALRWKIKDLLNFPVDQAVIDAFLLPQDSARDGLPMAYAAVAEESVVRQAVEVVNDSSLDLVSIDVAEMGLRNIAIGHSDSARGVAIVQLVQGGGALQVIRNNQIYLSRQLELEYNGGLLDDLPEEALTLELQRSLDYYERQMRQVPPQQILFCGENLSADKLTPSFVESLSAKSELLNLESQLIVDKEEQAHIVPLCLLALGAALKDSAALESAVGAAA